MEQLERRAWSLLATLFLRGNRCLSDV